MFIVITLLPFQVSCKFQRESLNEESDEEQIIIYKLLKDIQQKAIIISTWQETNMVKFYPNLIGKKRQNSGISNVEVNMMKILNRRLGQNPVNEI